MVEYTYPVFDPEVDLRAEREALDISIVTACQNARAASTVRRG